MSDLSMCCRLCLQMPDDTNILDLDLVYDEEEQLTYSECFMICTKIDIMAGARLPHNLCKSCGLELQMAYDFHKKVEKSNKALKDYMKSHPSQEEQLQQKLHQRQEQIQQQLEAELEIKQSGEEQAEFLEEEEEEEGQIVETIEFDPEMQLEIEKFEEEIIDLPVPDNIVEIDETTDGGDSVAEQDELMMNEEVIYVPPDDFNVEVETVQIKSLTNSPEDVYTIESFEVEVQKQSRSPSPSPTEEPAPTESTPLWQQAIVVVANNSYLPVNKKTLPQQHTSTEVQTLSNKNTEVISDDYVDGDDGGDNDDEAITSSDKQMDKTNQEVRKKRKHFKGKYSCDYCQKEFPNHSRMLIHRRSHQEDRPKFPCQLCFRSYNTKQALGVHERMAHTKEGYVCPMCTKVFAIEKSLEVHMRYHTGDFPFACDLCDKKFAQRGHLTTHKKIKHDNVRFVCNYPNCGKVFTSSSALRNHECKHTLMPFQCEFCSREYPAKAKLKTHIKRKHKKVMTLEELERMRKYYVQRSKPHLVKVTVGED